MHSIRRALLGAIAVAAVVGCAPGMGGVSQTYEQRYLPGTYNWQFRRNYPAADRLFNAFDYGHAILYETLWANPGAPVSELEERRYVHLTREVLVHPPRLPLEEAAIEPEYAKLVPEAKQMFDWAHVLHRQIYDVWADERISEADKDARVAELLRYYRTRPDLAFSTVPKNMDLMEGQSYSLAFRQRYPKFNGLIWAYHWLQVGLYEPLIAGRNRDDRQTGVVAAVARFRQMIEDAPDNMPRVMPMTAAVAPMFAARYPEAAIIFDNLHSMHDVVSDILANPSVPRERKGAEIRLAARRYRDDTSYVMSVQEWRDMAAHMGVQNMGGPVMGILTGVPAPTVERGARMSDVHADHSAPAGAAPAHDHAAMQRTPADSVRPAGGGQGTMRQLHDRLMADSVIHRRIMADSVLRRLVHGLMQAPSADAPRTAEPRRPAARRSTQPARRPAATRQSTTTQRRQPAQRPDTTRRSTEQHKH